MGPEINVNFILALEKQIDEGIGDVIHLKRTRNSLLNISTLVPPEILGHIFRWNVVTPVGDICGLRKGSYNFLLVCHHWFEVGSSTPALWTYWGDTPKQWSQQYRRSETAPVDLRLNSYHNTDGISFDGPLRDALRDRVARDSIRSVHLKGCDEGLLRSVISSLIVDGEDIRDSSIESLSMGSFNLGISDFLTRYRFPKLRNLRLSTNSTILSHNHLKLHATSLTTLSLGSSADSGLTTSQLFSILTSYPNLQDLTLNGTMIPHDVDNGSTPRLPLHHLKKLFLIGDYFPIFRLLDRLEYPGTLDSISLALAECEGEGIFELLAPYLQDHIQRDGRFRDRLGIQVLYWTSYISFEVGVVGELNTLKMAPGYHLPSVSFTAAFSDSLPPGLGEELCFDLVELTPREHVVEFTVDLCPHVVRDLLVTMPNIEVLFLKDPVVSDTFLPPDPPSHMKLLPSLRHLVLSHSTLQTHGDWRLLITYLTHQTSGGQAISLGLRRGRLPVPPEVVREIEGLVEEFRIIEEYEVIQWG